MPLNDEGMLDNDQAKMILQKMVGAGRAGVFTWDIDKNRFRVMETFTGRTFDQINTLEEFLHKMVFHKDVRMALKDAGFPILTENSDGIQVMTVHASKGLQFPVVFYAGLAEGLTPGKCEGNRKKRCKTKLQGTFKYAWYFHHSYSGKRWIYRKQWHFRTFQVVLRQRNG